MSNGTPDVEMDDILSGLDAPTEAPAEEPKAKAKAKAKAKPAAKTKGTGGKPLAAKKEPRDTAIEGQGAKADWPVIEIDEVEGQANFHFVQINGVPFQIPRGVETPVPPAVLEVLQNAIAGRVVQQRDPASGQMSTKVQKHAAVPYRIVRWGKQ